MNRLARRLAVLLLLALPAGANAAWYEASSAHFRVYAEGDEKSARDLATRLETYDKGMRVLNGLSERETVPAKRVTVYVLPDLAAIQRLRRGAGGFYIPRAQGSVAFTPRRAGRYRPEDLTAEGVLFHEYAHHFLLQNYSGAFPAWFIEGFAELNMTARFEEDGSMSFGAPADHRIRMLNSTKGFPSESLFAPGQRRDVAMVYGRGWLLSHYLTFEPSRRGQLHAYLSALMAGKPGVEAARSAFGDLKKLDRDLDDYLERRRLNGVQVAASALAIGPISIRPLTAGEAATMRFRQRIERGISKEEVRELLPDLREAGAPYSDDLAVQVLLSEAENRAGNRDEADAAADRALALAPTSADALIQKAYVALDRARDSGDAAAFREARKRIAAANRADPDNPEPLILFYRSFVDQHAAPNANAVDGLLRAFELAPQDRTLRLNVGHQYLADGKAGEARRTLAPLAFDPHGGARAEAVRAVLAKLDEGGSQAALAAWGGVAAARGEDD